MGVKGVGWVRCKGSLEKADLRVHLIVTEAADAGRDWPRLQTPP